VPLVPVDLPDLADIGHRWAAYAAVMAAIGYDDMCNATPQRWHYDDAGGNWVDLMVLDGGTAVLAGSDHEYSETYWREAAVYFQEEETDLLADAPDWWGAPLPHGDDLWISFVYGFDGTRWQRAEYELDDGFTSLAAPAFSDDRYLDLVSEFISGRASDNGFDHQPTREALMALVEQGPNLREADLAAVMGPVPANLEAGVAAAAAFFW
jgi:hypothetical protein